MKDPFEILTYKCSQCGQPTDEPGLCPACRGETKCGGDGQWVECNPAMPDCDCPMIGYAKLHVPGCKYF